ncbi:ribosomal protein S18-alanine N-acetyltransferase [Haloferacaceae archaeon DSL9]
MTATSPDRNAVEFAIRRAERADLLAIHRIEKTVFDQPWPYSAFETFLEQAGFLVATVDSAIVGYVVADVTPNFGRDLGHVKDLAVHPDAQGMGIGRALLQRALLVLSTEGAAMVKLEVRESNDPAQALYYDEGFRPMRRIPRYYSDGEAAVIMVVEMSAWMRGER